MTDSPDAFDAELDLLFQQLPAAHVEARKALADKLRKAGDRAGAERLKKIKRPTSAAWALNLLHFQQPALLQAAQQATAAVLSLHARDGVGASDLSSAVAAQRRAVQAALDAAVRGCAEAGLAIGSVDQRRIETTLQAWLKGAGDEAPGRMTHDLEASGFDAVATVGIPSPRPAPTVAVAMRAPTSPAPAAGAAPAQAMLPLVAAKPHKPAPDPERVSRAKASVQKREREAEAARKLASQVRSDLAAQQMDVERTRERTREAERVLAALVSELKQQEASLKESGARSADAESALSSAERALLAARADLARLSATKYYK